MVLKLRPNNHKGLRFLIICDFGFQIGDYSRGTKTKPLPDLNLLTHFCGTDLSVELSFYQHRFIDHDSNHFFKEATVTLRRKTSSLELEEEKENCFVVQCHDFTFKIDAFSV